jgi:hypothetical protein
MEAMKTVARAVHHRQAEDRAGQLRVAEDLLFDRDLVVVFVEPAEHLLEYPYLFGRIGLQLRPEARRFGERQRLELAWLETVKHPARAVHVHAAQREHASRDAAKQGHQLLRLPARAQDEVDDHLGPEGAEIGAEVGQVPPITNELTDAGRQLRRVGTAMEDRDVMTTADEAPDERRSDEPGATDDQDPHPTMLLVAIVQREPQKLLLTGDSRLSISASAVGAAPHRPPGAHPVPA